MARTLALVTLVTLGVAASYAGPLGINPGNYLNPDGTVSVGLMPNTGTMMSGTANSADGLTGSFWGQRNYHGVSLLNGATVTNPLPQTSTSCGANCQGGITTVPPYTAGTATIYTPPSAPVFNLLGDNLLSDSANTTNAWISTTNASASGTLNIPTGIFGVTSVATMLNNTGTGTQTGTVCTTNNGMNAGVGCSGTNSYAYITFSFTDSQGGAVGSEAFALMNGVTQRNVMNAGGENTISGYSVTDTSTSAVYNVSVGNLYSSETSTGGQMVLDYQIFPIFTEFQGYTLSNISITSVKGSTSSQELLSAITLTTAASTNNPISQTPEPGTIVLALAGLCVAGLFRSRSLFVR